MTNKRAQRKHAAVERSYRPLPSNSMGIQGDYSRYTGGNSVTIPTHVLAQMLQSMAPQKNQAKDFAPGSPLQPYQGVVPLGGPRQFSYNTGINLNSNDRSMGKPDIPSFEQLRLLAMLYDGIGLCERVILDMIPKLEPKVSIRKELAKAGMKEENFRPRIKIWMDFLEMPSPGQQLDTHSWLRMAWTEQTQIDALAMFKHKNRGGGLYGLEIIAGETVKPILDERGMVPLANQGFPAFQQYPYGVPGDLYTTDTMLYYRESPRAFTPYGFSRVERIITRVNQALRKEQYNLSQFTEGNLPAGIMEVPDSSQWTPDQIDSFEQLWNALIAGNVQQQARIKFTQPGMKYTQFVNPVNGEHMTEFDEFLLNVAAACYGLSMGDLAFTGDIHKSSGDSQQNMMFRRTLAPLVMVYSRILTKVLRESFGDDELEVSFGGYDEAEDLVAQSTAYGGFVTSGILSPASAARLMNFPEIPETGPFLMPQGAPQPIFLEDLANPDVRKAQQAAQMAGLQMAATVPTTPPAGGKAAEPGNSPAQGEQKPAEGSQPASTDKSESGNGAGDSDLEQGLSDAEKSLSTLDSGSSTKRSAEPTLVERQIAELLERVEEVLERTDPARDPNGEFGYYAGKKQPTGHHKTGTHKTKSKGAHHGPKLSQRERLTARMQKLAARFDKLEARKLGKKWSADQQAAAGALSDIFSKLADSISSGKSNSTDKLLDAAYAQAKVIFAGNPKGMNAMAHSLTLIDAANDKGIRVAVSEWRDDDEDDEFGVDELEEMLDVLEREDAASRIADTMSNVEEPLRMLRAHNVTFSGIDEDGYARNETIEVPADGTVVYSTHKYRSTGEEPHNVTRPLENAENVPQRMAVGTGAISTAVSRNERAATAGDGEIDHPGRTNETERSIHAEYRRWRTRAIEDIKASRPIRDFTSTIIPENDHRALTIGLACCDTADQVRAMFEKAREWDTSPKVIGADSGASLAQNKSTWKLRW